MITREQLQRAAAMPPHVLARRVAERVVEKVRAPLIRRAMARRPTFMQATSVIPRRLLPELDPHEIAGALAPLAEPLAWAAENWLAHRFDLLGSGWTDANRGADCAGLAGYRYPPAPVPAPDPAGRWLRDIVNSANVPESSRRWRLIDDPGYRAIDWQLDLRTGYRWSESSWSEDLTFADVPGADVKLPWELARGQHMPQMALAYAAAAGGDSRFATPAAYVREFRAQVLDFLATNPPSYGINWRCTMDVAIRAANWALAADMFQALGATFDEPFRAALGQGLFEHAHFIRHHLEWHPVVRANHYLADIAGLVVCATYLPDGSDRREWLAFAATELLRETELQFDDQGANFEASTSYHRLSAEMALWALCVALRCGALSPDDIPTAVAERVRGMADFTTAVTKSSGLVAQIGDNDNGRFTKLAVAWQRGGPRPGGGWDKEGWHEVMLDHRHLLALIGGATGDAALVREAGTNHAVDALIVGALANGLLPARPPQPPVMAPATAARTDGGHVSWTIHLPGADLREGITTHAFPDFGLYVYRSARLFLSIRCGAVGQNGNGGHAHNDQLAVELTVDGVDWIRDPGTYVYTSLPAERNRYRSIGAHFAPRCGDDEPCPLSVGLFTLPDRARPVCVAFDEFEFVGRHSGFGGDTSRTVRLLPDRIEIVDVLLCVRHDVAHDVHSPEEMGALLPDTPPFSPAYGVIE